MESAWYRWLNFYRDSWQRRFTGNVIEDTSDSVIDSECDLPRSSNQDFQFDSTSRYYGTAPTTPFTRASPRMILSGAIKWYVR